MRQIIASALLIFAASGSALAAGPAVPAVNQRELTALLGQIGAPDLMVLPSKAPAHFAFESFSVTGSPFGLDISLVDQRFVKTRAQARRHEISYDTAYFKGACGAKSHKTLQAAKTTVYSSGGTVWRCLRTSRGRVVRVSAHGPLAQAQLAALVASARP